MLQSDKERAKYKSDTPIKPFIVLSNPFVIYLRTKKRMFVRLLYLQFATPL